MVDILSDMDAQEKIKLQGFLRGLMQDREGRLPSSKCQFCGTDTGQSSKQPITCRKCELRISCCVRCGSKTSEELCPQCIKGGARCCDLCLRPTGPTGGMCKQCDDAKRGVGKVGTNLDLAPGDARIETGVLDVPEGPVSPDASYQDLAGGVHMKSG